MASGGTKKNGIRMSSDATSGERPSTAATSTVAGPFVLTGNVTLDDLRRVFPGY